MKLLKLFVCAVFSGFSFVFFSCLYGLVGSVCFGLFVLNFVAYCLLVYHPIDNSVIAFVCFDRIIHIVMVASHPLRAS